MCHASLQNCVYLRLHAAYEVVRRALDDIVVNSQVRVQLSALPPLPTQSLVSHRGYSHKLGNVYQSHR